ncbi:hypothetical protein MMC24_002325 [Lignoscripta atroalba]|nr:hypothetical protein [Lignoscripta atroalba]
MLYAFGSNGSGQLGLGHITDTSSPQECKATLGWEKVPGIPLKVAAGGNHTLILYSSERVYAGGASHGHTGQVRSIPVATSFSEALLSSDKSHRIKFCSAMWEASVVVTTDDRVFTCGSGAKGELGRGMDLIQVQKAQNPLKFSNSLPKGATIVDLAGSVSHAVIVLSNGDVYGWGNGRKGQLGETAGIIWEPRKIQGLGFKVNRAVCGREFTYLVGDAKEGRHTILGSDKWDIKSTAPEAVPDWKDIAASWGSIFVLKESGQIVSWGRNDHGQLASHVMPPVMKMAVGSEHVLVLTQDRRVFAWGWGEHGNCGGEIDKDGDVKDRCNEISIPDTERSTEIVGIGAGCATSWIWTKPP